MNRMEMFTLKMDESKFIYLDDKIVDSDKKLEILKNINNYYIDSENKKYQTINLKTRKI